MVGFQIPPPATRSQLIQRQGLVTQPIPPRAARDRIGPPNRNLVRGSSRRLALGYAADALGRFGGGRPQHRHCFHFWTPAPVSCMQAIRRVRSMPRIRALSGPTQPTPPRRR